MSATDPEDGPGQEYRAGFACVVGRPNAGKSTLTNALVRQKVAITSSRPQTTRRAIRGIVHRPEGQLVLVDTPGLHRPRTLLGERLNDLVMQTLAEVDVIVFCLPADQAVGPGDRYIAEQLADARTPVVAVVTKTDVVSRAQVAAHLLAVNELGDWADIVPVSAQQDYQLDVLVQVLFGHLPPSPPLYPEGDLTDEPEAVMVAELVREAALEDVHDELPHSLAVVVDEIVEVASSFVLMLLAYDMETIRKGLPLDFKLVGASGALIVVLTGLGAIVFGEPFLKQAIFSFSLPLYGRVEFSTVTLFEAGVALAVVGVVVTIILSIAEDV